jgi:hypothetical protein
LARGHIKPEHAELGFPASVFYLDNIASCAQATDLTQQASVAMQILDLRCLLERISFAVFARYCDAQAATEAWSPNR